jgi:hypothetical protein
MPLILAMELLRTRIMPSSVQGRTDGERVAAVE